MSNFLIFKAAFNNSATPAIGTYTAEGATALLSPAHYLYNTAAGTAVQWFVPTAETTDFEFVADILTRDWTNRVTYFIIADSTGTTRLCMWSQYNNWFFENSDSDNTSGTEYIGVITPTTSGGFGVFHQFRVRVRKLTASSSSVEVYVDGTLKLTATAGAALVTCAKIGFVGGVNTFGPGTDAGVKNAYVYDLSGGDVIDRGVLSGAFNRFISWMKTKFALKSDIPTVNNGTLTIQKNGTTVDTFTANSSTDKTVNITVPTKTSDLTNDSGFITSDATKIPLSGSNQISGSLIPSTDGTVNLGSPSYQWNNAYIKSLTINGVAAGDILTHNASEFVDVSTAQTIGGVKTFSSNVIIQGSKKVTCNLDSSFIELDGGTTWGKGGSIVLSGQDRSSYTNSVLIVSKSDTNTDMIQYQNGELKPLSNNTNNSSLGTSTNKWKSFNGINPGALSLPSTATGCVDIKSTVGQYLKDNNTNIYEFTAPFDGWVCVGIVKGSLRIDNNTTSISSGSENIGYWNSYTIPFRKDDVIQIKINKMDPTDDYVNDIMWKAYIYPCQGNV